jgi:hypothetical protein
LVGHYADHDFTAHDSAQRLRSTHILIGYHRSIVCVTFLKSGNYIKIEA